MARQVLPWVGAAVGFMIGGPAGAQWGFAIGGIVGNAVDPQVINGPKLGEGQDNTASEGGFRPIVLGKGAVGVCMIHEGPLKKRTIRHRQSKGGGPVTTEERAYRTMAFALGESAYPETGVQLTRLWIDNKLRYDVTPTSQILAESSEFEDQFTFYPGDNDQQPDPDLEAFLGAGNVPSYRGGAPYIVFPDWDVTDSRGMAPMIKAEVASTAEAPSTIVAFRDPNGTFSDFTFIDEGWGTDWVSSPNLDRAGWDIYSIGLPAGRVLYHTGNTHPAIVFPNGTITVSSGEVMSPSGGSLLGWYAAGTVLVAGGIEPMRYSFDYGSSFSILSDSAGSNAVCAIEDGGVLIWLSFYLGMVRSSAGNINSWSDPAVVDNSFATVMCRWSDGETAMFGGTSSDAITPKLYAFKAGVEFSPEPLPAFVTATAITAIHEADGLWVLGTNSGEFAWRDEAGNWTVSDDDLGVRCYEITHDGAGFVAIGPGIIKSSTDGGHWVTRSTWGSGGQVYFSISATVPSITSEKIPLHQVVSWIHSRVGFPEHKVSVSELSDEVEGIVFSDGYTAADAIRTLMALYFFDAGEFDAGSGYRLNYVKRGGAASVTLTEADIVEGPEDWEREDSYERPRALHVAYQNPVADYGAPNITIKRTSPDVLVTGERSLSVPVVFSDVDEITQRADVMMTVAYTEIAGTYEIVLPDIWLELAPTVTIGFSIRGKVRRLRMTEWAYVDGVIKSKWMADRQSAYTSNLTGLPVVPTTPPPPSIVGPTVSVVLDIPALADSMDSLHMLVAASGQTPAWYGSVHQIKPPFEIDFATAAVFSGISTIMGLLQDDVTAASQHYTDTTNVVRVTLYSDDELQTYTQQQFLAENGAFALAYDDGGVRRWEILQYRDAVKVGDKEWELTTLARGRLNTEAAAHPSGSLFVLLDAGLRTIPAQTAWLGEDIDHRAVSYGQLPDQATPYTETYTGESQREFPVAHLFGKIDGDDLLLFCVPRHRFGTDDHPVQSINHDGYAWTATDGTNSADATTAGPSHTFDVTGWTTPITVTIAQLNRITGAGPTVTEVIE